MPRLKIENSYAPLAPERLTAFEQELGCRFPADYRRFLLKHNGGMPTPSEFRWGTEAYSDSMVHWFLPLEPESPPPGESTGERTPETPTLVQCHFIYQIREQRVAPDLLPIALDPGGNLVCLGIKGKRRGQVFFWDHEAEGEGWEEAETDNLSLVAPTFSDFLKLLKDEEDPDMLFYSPINDSLNGGDLSGFTETFEKGLLSPDHVLKQHGFSLLEYSAYFHAPDVTAVLLEHGAKATLQSARDMAVARGNQASAALIEAVLQRDNPSS